MNATEVIEQIKKLTPEERRLVQDYLWDSESLKDAPLTGPLAEIVDRETFEKVSKWAMEEHRELLSRLAK